MELDDLAKRLLPFSQAHYNDKDISVSNVTKMPGHAGFSYGFTVTTQNREDSWYIRLPPPNVKLEGTADVMRQVTALNLLPDSVPHCKVKWFGEATNLHSVWDTKLINLQELSYTEYSNYLLLNIDYSCLLYTSPSPRD